MSLKVGFEVATAHVKPRICLSLPTDHDWISGTAPVPARMLSTMIIIDSTSETISKTPVKCFFS